MWGRVGVAVFSENWFVSSGSSLLLSWNVAHNGTYRPVRLVICKTALPLLSCPAVESCGRKSLLRTQSLKVVPLKPGVGKYIATRAILTAWDFCLANFYSSGPFTCIFSKNLSRVFHVLAVANTGSCVGP